MHGSFVHRQIERARVADIVAVRDVAPPRPTAAWLVGIWQRNLMDLEAVLIKHVLATEGAMAGAAGEFDCAGRLRGMFGVEVLAQTIRSVVRLAALRALMSAQTSAR